MVPLMAFLRGAADGIEVLQHVHVSSSAYWVVILCMRGDAGRPSFASSNLMLYERKSAKGLIRQTEVYTRTCIPLGRI